MSSWFKSILATVLLLVSSSAFSQGNNFEDPVDWSFGAEKISDTEYDLIFKATIEDGWYVYSQFIGDAGPVPTSFSFEDSSGTKFTLVGHVTEESDHTKEAMDPIWGAVIKKFGHEVTFKQRIQLVEPTDSVKGYLEFMTCDDTKCLPPDYVDFGIDLNKTGLVNQAKEEIEVDESKEYGRFGEVISEICNALGLKPSGYLAIFLLGMLGGFFALLTPCVFPMIPLTVSFFTKRNEQKSKGIFEAFFYGFSIIFIYFLASTPFIIFQLPASTLNEIATSPLLNAIFFLIFLVFAISFFGYFEIVLPSSLVNKADSASNIGGLVGIFFMAVTLVIVSFSCTGPILGTLLVGSLTADAGSQYNIVFGFTGFGVALALPFAIFAAFPSLMNKLPKSGGWLNTVKVVLGFLELAFALKFISNADIALQLGLIKRELFLAIWILLALGMAAYLFGLIKFPHDSKKIKLGFGRISTGLISVAFAIYMIPGLMGVNLKLLSGLTPPLIYSYYFEKSDKDEEEDEHRHYTDYEEGLAAALRLNKPMLVDFTGWNCANCRKMEEYIWTDDRVKELLKEFVIVSLYVDEKVPLSPEKLEQLGEQGKKYKNVGDMWTTLQVENFKSNSQPWHALVTPDERIITNPMGYTKGRDVDTYITYLECSLEAFYEYQADKQ